VKYTEGAGSKSAVAVGLSTPFGLPIPGLKSSMVGKDFLPRPERRLIANNLLNNG